MRTPVPLARMRRTLLPLALTPLAVLMLGAPAQAQDDEDFDEDELVDADEMDEDDGKAKKVDLSGDDDGADGSPRRGGADDDVDDAPPEKPAAAGEADLPDFDAVRPVDREIGDRPLIENKLYSTQFRFELTGVFDYSYSDKFIQHIGGHLSAAFHILDWVAVEGWAGGYYPRELPITRTVRQVGYSFTNLQIAPQLGDLWQTFAFAGAGVQWAPFYGKFSIFSEVDLSFQLYFVGGVTLEAIAKPQQPVAGQAISNQRDFFPGLVSGVGYDYFGRVSATYGAGVRIIPWKYLAFRLEFRNQTGLNPPAVGPAIDAEGGLNSLFDLTNMPLLNVGISLML
jgi:outer membrane beta-barrel protein